MCTTIIITKGATADGSMVVTHSDDNELSDQRIIKVPAQTHKPKAQRQIFTDNCRYPRFVTNERGNGYRESKILNHPDTTPIGYIPQVAETYAYFDGNYGIMNEHNLMIGECTCAAFFQPGFITAEEALEKGTHQRLFYSSELSRIALERCKKAEDAIDLMGELIEKYGYYSTGETLLVADEDTAWVFEMCALDDDQYHSVWAAQEVPDGELFVAANQFKIRTIKKSINNHYIDKDQNINIKYSKFLFPGLKKQTKTELEEIDWLKAISPGEYAHPYYSLRRVWSVQNRVNPDLGLSPWVDDTYTNDYPFSIKPKNKLSLQEIFSLYRDHYEGTEFDLTKGVAAGPYGDPHRFVGKYDPLQNNMSGTSRKYFGAWERSISVFYQGYTYVNQIRPKAPDASKGIIWLGADVSYTTCFVPIPTSVSDIPNQYEQINPQHYEGDKAWWIFNVVGAYARLNYQRMCKVDIIPLQQQLETQQQKLVESWDNIDSDDKELKLLITKKCQDNIDDILKQWKQLRNLLFTKYADGYINKPEDKAAIDLGYSADWLAETNYRKGPVKYDMKTEE